MALNEREALVMLPLTNAKKARQASTVCWHLIEEG
jgi:hypothetical protein